MADQRVESSPQVVARIGGVLYLIVIAAGTLIEAAVRDKLIVSGDAATTAGNVMASALLWRISIAGELMTQVCSVALALVFYVLLRPISRNLALLAVFFNLVSIAIQVANSLNLFAALFLLESAEYLKALDPNQLHALSYLSLKSQGYGFGISLVFFGCECLVLGVLIFKSGYLPRTLGVLMNIAGVCYLFNSFALFLSPAFENSIFPAVLVPAFIAESSLCLWLMVKGVNVAKWQGAAAQEDLRS
jgi:Domain of unknown function (DUF4386)